MTKLRVKTKYLALIVEILFLVNPGFAQKIVADSRNSSMKIRIIVKIKMKIYIIGIGLIGGSMALDIKDYILKLLFTV
jgi:hypothetical protein